MLVLARACGEVICIGDEVRVTVVRLSADKVRLGIEAPDGVAVDREEVRRLKVEAVHESSKGSAAGVGGSAGEPPRLE